jgi:glucose/arabinose dehydrogenase
MGRAGRRAVAQSAQGVRDAASDLFSQSQIAGHRVLVVGKRKSQIRSVLIFALLVCITSTGCTHRVKYYRPGEQPILTRDVVEFPANTQMAVLAEGLTAPTCICFDYHKNILFVAEHADRDGDPHIYGVRMDRPGYPRFDVYPVGRRVPFIKTGFEVSGPIGGMVVAGGKLYVTHRDANGRGMITAFTDQGAHTTVVAGLPAQGDFGLTDITVRPTDGRLFFGMGTATNSGVVGNDNWQVGWVRKHAKVADQSSVWLKLNGYKFFTPNPDAGLFGGPDIAVTGPFQPFGTSDKNRISPAIDGKPNGAIYSVSPAGGDLVVEATGLHYPRGLAFTPFRYPRLYATNNGMELRGSRPVKDDPDALLWIISGTWYGWPDFSADLSSIGEERFQPPPEMARRYGYPDLSPVIDLNASNPPNRLRPPDRETLLYGAFPSLSGTAKLAFAPSSGPFKEYEGSAIITQFGDRAPFASGGLALQRPVGYKLIRVDVDSPKREVSDFVVNTARLPASKLGKGVVALERPVDVKFGPDGAMYVLDYGVMRMKGGQEYTVAGTGRIFKLTGLPQPTTATAPATTQP